MKQTNKNLLIVILLLSVIINSCKINDRIEIRSFSNKNGDVIGDSVFLNDVLQKVVFKDTSLMIDSVVYEWFENKSLKSVYTYIEGKKVFENKDYYENGTIKKYSFLDDKCPNCFYTRNYDSKGLLINELGELFFQGYLTEINPETLEIKNGTDMDVKIFFPSPPDYKAFLYVDLDNNIKGDVFFQDKYVGFLKTVSVDIDKELGDKVWSEIDVCLELQGERDTLFYRKPIFYKVVD